MPAADENPRGPGKTLGDVLYAGKTRSTPIEEDWVLLVKAVAAGDQQALHALYERTHRLVFTLTVRIVSNREAAEELTVDVFHDVWKRASAYDPANGTVVGWIMNQARSRAIDRLRFDQRRKRVNPHPDEPVSEDAGPGPQETLQSKQQELLLQEALKRLAPDERLAIETAFFSELTHAEVADRLKQPLGTVKTRIRSGLRKLRETLEGKE